MTTRSNAVPDSPLDSQSIAPAAHSATRPMYWSVRRELWENRSIYFGPLAVAGIVMVGFLISLIGLPRSMRTMAASHRLSPSIEIAMPYAHAAWLLYVTAFLVAVFYSLEALHGERRDRSILFWKSLPVSDLTTVLSKASIPLVVLPLVVFAIVVATQIAMLMLSTTVLLMSGANAAMQWTHLPLLQMQLGLLYGLIVLALWHAPLHAWLLLVSAWARRTTFLWAVLPLLAICAVEQIAFHTSHFALLLKDRLIGFAAEAFAFRTPDGVAVDPHFIPLTQLTPGKFLSSPGLWVGLVVAAIFLAAAVRLRRYREPI
jgi:ABC-2 type transport system permease protein